MENYITKKRQNALDFARDYKKLGWSPIPLPHKEKFTRREGWETWIIPENELENHFNGKPQNIGVLLGDKSGGLVDVDLDAPFAVKFADYFLPKTGAEFGRKSKPRSHRLYISDFPKTERFVNPFQPKNEATISEIRSTGGQTVFPGSTHTSGEPVEWENTGKPAKVDAQALRRAIGLLNAACIVAQDWNKAARHDAALALSGALLRNDYTADETRNFLQAVCYAAGDEETQDRLKTVVTTAESIKSGRKVFGFPKLAEILGKEKVDKVCDFLNIQKKPEQIKPPKESQATKILNFADDFELFHTADKEAFATIDAGGHSENHLLRSKSFRAWLSWQFYQAEGQMPGTQAIQDAINALEGKAIFDAPETEIFIRVASANGRIYLDLCNEKWQIVEISKSGWRVIESQDAPIKFYRTKAMMPLPIPIKSGADFSLLRNYLTVDDNEYILISAFLVSCIRSGFPFPIVIFTSEQGTGKSTAARVMRRLVDPNKTDFRSAPREERDLVIAATNAWLCSYDNISVVPDWLSDALCRISTGGGFSTRTLYENSEETIFAAKRPILLNGIGEIANNGDILDRAVLIKLKPISKDERKTEAEFWGAFEKDHVAIFSGLLDAVVTALNNIDITKLAKYPRMADFAQWSAAAESAFGFKKNAFINAFEANQNAGNYIALEGSAFAEVIQKYAKTNGNFSGNLQGFLDALKPFTTDEQSKSKTYPKTARGVRGKLERINPNLRAIGINIEFGERTEKGQIVTLERKGFQPSEPSEPSEVPQTKGEKPDGWLTVGTLNVRPSANRQDVNTNKNKGFGAVPDVPDVPDGSIHTHSKKHIRREV